MTPGRPRPAPRGAKWGVAVAAFVACTASSAARAEPSPADIKTARQLFADAERLRAQGDCEGAAAKLELAIAIKETPGLRFHLAHCEERLGRLVKADADYRRAAELIGGGMNAPDVQALLEPARKSLSERLPTLRIRVASLSPPARVRLDGQEVRPDALANFIPVDPGKHTVLAEAEGHDPFQIELSIAEGDDRVIDARLRAQGARAPAPGTVAPAPAAAPAPADPRKDEAGFGAREAVVLGEAALALAGLGVGVAYWFKYESAGDEVDSLYAAIDAVPGGCGENSTPSISVACERLPGALTDQAHAGNIAIGGFVGAGVFGAAAVATWLLWPSRTPKASAVLVVPFPGGAALSGAF